MNIPPSYLSSNEQKQSMLCTTAIDVSYDTRSLFRELIVTAISNGFVGSLSMNVDDIASNLRWEGFNKNIVASFVGFGSSVDGSSRNLENILNYSKT